MHYTILIKNCIYQNHKYNFKIWNTLGRILRLWYIRYEFVPMDCLYRFKKAQISNVYMSYPDISCKSNIISHNEQLFYRSNLTLTYDHQLFQALFQETSLCYRITDSLKDILINERYLSPIHKIVSSGNEVCIFFFTYETNFTSYILHSSIYSQHWHISILLM